MTDKQIIIYTDRETGKYKSYDCVHITEKLSLEKIQGYINNWNNSQEQKTYAKLYDDPVLVDFVGDVHCSITFNRFIEDLKYYSERIGEISDNIRYECRGLTEFLEENYKDESNDR